MALPTSGTVGKVSNIFRRLDVGDLNSMDWRDISNLSRKSKLAASARKSRMQLTMDQIRLARRNNSPLPKIPQPGSGGGGGSAIASLAGSILGSKDAAEAIKGLFEGNSLDSLTDFDPIDTPGMGLDPIPGGSFGAGGTGTLGGM